jgi:PAS domain S-box-containing protein
MKQTSSLRRPRARPARGSVRASNNVPQQPRPAGQGQRDLSEVARLKNENDEGAEIRKALGESNERFASFFHAVSVGLVLTGPAGEIRMGNKAALDLLGLSEDEVVGKSSYDPDWLVVYEDGRPCPGRERPIPRAIATRQPVCDTVVGIFRPRSQDYVWLRVDALPRLAPDGSVSEVLCWFLDVTAGREALLSLTAWKNRYDAAIRASGQILYDWDAVSNEVVYGGEYQRILGYSAQDLAGGLARFMELIHPDDHDMVWTEIQRVLVTRELYRQDYRVRTKDGRYIVARDQRYFYLNDGGKVVRVVGVISDITEQRRAEEALRASEERFRTAFARAATGMLLVDLEGRFIEANAAYCAMTGYTQAELASLTFLAITHPEDVQKCATPFNQLLAGQFPSYVLEKRYIRKDGSVVWVRISSMLVHDAKNLPSHIVTVVEDITERKRAEEELSALSERLLRVQDEERRRLARELHDSTAQNVAALCMNLGVVSESAELLDWPAQKALRECLELGEQCIRELRTFSYLLHPPVLDDLGLCSALRWYVEGFAQRSGIEVALDLAADLGRLPRDVELMLFRIIQESLTNIHRHSGSRTAVIRIVRHPKEVFMQVRDDGHGISGALKPSEIGAARVGVGIAGMKERVRLAGGHLKIRSRPDGTDVEVLVPLSHRQV